MLCRLKVKLFVSVLIYWPEYYVTRYWRVSPLLSQLSKFSKVILWLLSLVLNQYNVLLDKKTSSHWYFLDLLEMKWSLVLHIVTLETVIQCSDVQPLRFRMENTLLWIDLFHFNLLANSKRRSVHMPHLFGPGKLFCVFTFNYQVLMFDGKKLT